MRKFAALITAFSFFASLLVFPEAAAASALNGLKTCAHIIIPSLFPFFVATKLLSELGLTRLLGTAMSPVCQKLFRVSGAGGTAFIVGITGGYPLGAAYIADMRKTSEISRSEAERLLVFCNNSGPAFIIGAVGVGVFSSVYVGLFLFAVHILSAMAAGIVLAPKDSQSTDVKASKADTPPFSIALTNAVKSSVTACISVSGFVVAFSVLTGILERSGFYPSVIGSISSLFGTELHWSRALLSGVFELGNAIASMSGLGITPLNLALAAFILGWGGISVHFQTFSMLEGTDIKTARYVIGRFFIALLGSAMALLGAVLIF